MRFQFFGPLKEIAGEYREVDLEAPVRLKELTGLLAEWLGAFVPYGRETTEPQLMANLSFFRHNTILRINDRIEPEDVILVFLPPTGG